MVRRKEKPQEKPYDPWEHYQSIQLTPEQKAANREEVERKMAEVAKTGVYEKLLDLIGKVHIPYDKEEMREDRD